MPDEAIPKTVREIASPFGLAMTKMSKGDSMQDLVNRLKPLQDLTQQLLVRL